MPENLKEKTVMVIDFGGHFPVVERLVKDYGRVLLYIPWERPFPKFNQYVIGKNVPGVERVYNIWQYYDQVDLFYFCHLWHGEFQDWLRAEGKAVFGPGRGEEMEIFRDRMKVKQRTLGLPINEYDVLYGLDALRDYLQENDNKYIKTNIIRGQLESFHHQEYRLTEPLLDELEHTIPVYKDDIVFIAEEPIEAIAEIGYDGFVIDGKFPDKALTGIEIKDAAYCGVVMEYARLPEQMREINSKLSETFAAYQYRGVYTNEIRIGVDRKGYLIDQTCRHPDPPTALQLEMYEDYGQLVWKIAHGEVPPIKVKFRYGVQVAIKSEYARTNAERVYFPPQYKDFVKIQNLAIVDGVHCYIPQEGIESDGIGWVLGMGNSLDAAKEQCRTIAKEISGYQLKCCIDALDKVDEEIEKLSKAGIKLF